jgi:effector-binding domain-containing protein
MATENAFPRTSVGVTEVKTLPSGRLLKAAAPGNYFDQSNRLFRQLFNYISTHDIAMTTPVEARIVGAEMYFWVDPGQREKATGDSGGVEVIEVPERRVASLGARGGYSAENFAKTRDALVAWLARQTGLKAAGEPYGVFWDGPFIPGFLKRYEVHVPVVSVGP